MHAHRVAAFAADLGRTGDRPYRASGARGDADEPTFRCVVGVASNDVPNVRSGPSASYAIVGRLTNHTFFVEVIAKRGRWFKITKDGTTGWVNSHYLN
ncbi:SH3 domain-containing protein [Methyloceanibacter caenitepidi]|uniref:SH3 domain-containing protein n=1 Tax=Methyloceanibacter caenitepidi TaxID=1384459 RepID=UPI0005F0452D|nr:SH3 domain-containing protein [Methyloceanibacter caenitepidi]